jgi:hypothetical protein
VDPVRDPDRLPEAAATGAQGSLLAEAELLPSPAPSGAQAPELSLVGGRPALTWLERTGEDSGDWRLRFARWSAGSGQPAEPGGFGEPVTVAPAPGEPLELFANWADRPGVVEGGPAGAPGGLAQSRPLYAWWLAKLGGGTYAYGVHVARSTDGGRTWEPLGLLHDDSSPTEHGFVTLIPEDEGVRAVWLDGRATARGAPMALRTVRITDRVERATEELLDSAVCDCCNTAAVATSGGPWSPTVTAPRARSGTSGRSTGQPGPGRSPRRSTGTVGRSPAARSTARRWPATRHLGPARRARPSGRPGSPPRAASPGCWRRSPGTVGGASARRSP